MSIVFVVCSVENVVVFISSTETKTVRWRSFYQKELELLSFEPEPFPNEEVDVQTPLDTVQLCLTMLLTLERDKSAFKKKTKTVKSNANILYNSS